MNSFYPMCSLFSWDKLFHTSSGKQVFWTC